MLLNLQAKIIEPARAIEIEHINNRIVITCDDGKSYKLSIKENDVSPIIKDKVIDEWFLMILETKCEGVLK